MVDGKVVVRAAFNQGWRGNKYEQDEIMPATDEQAARLTRSGQAYYGFEESEPENQPDTEPAKPTMDNSKKEIEEYLDEQEVEYSEYKTKSELLDLIE